MKKACFIDTCQDLCAYTPPKRLFLCAHTALRRGVVLTSKIRWEKGWVLGYILYNNYIIRKGGFYHIELTFRVRKGDVKKKMWVVNEYFWEKVCEFQKIKVFLQLLYQ